MKIMLVEDEALSVMLMKHMLKQFGLVDVHEFASGEKALEMLSTVEPDLVLMDIMLAGKLDGIDTTIAIKKILDVPVIYTTGYDEKDFRERATRSGAAAFMVKPIEPDKLKAAIQSCRQF